MTRIACTQNLSCLLQTPRGPFLCVHFHLNNLNHTYATEFCFGFVRISFFATICCSSSQSAMLFANFIAIGHVRSMGIRFAIMKTKQNIINFIHYITQFHKYKRQNISDINSCKSMFSHGREYSALPWQKK